MTRDGNYLVLSQAGDIVSYDPKTRRVLQSWHLDRRPFTITRDNSGGIWALCRDKTVKQKKWGQPEFVTQFEILHSPVGESIAVVNENKVILTNHATKQIEVYERSSSTGWSMIHSISSAFNREFDFLFLSRVVVDSLGRVIICDQHNHRVVVLDENFRDQIEISSTQFFKLDRPAAVAIDEMDNIYVAEFQSKRVLVLDRDGNYLNAFDHTLPGMVSSIEVLDGRIYVWTDDDVLEELRLK